MVFQPMFPVLIIIATVVVGLGFIAFAAWTNKSNRGWWYFRSLYVVAVGLLLLRPSVSEFDDVEVYTNQYDIYVVVDATASMVAEDWVEGSTQTRLDGVKQDIQNLTMAYNGAKFSLIKFDSISTNVTTPLTKDVTAFMTSVRNLTPELSRQAQGSSPYLPADALKSVIDRNTEVDPDRARIVFYFGDGESTKPGATAATFAPIAETISGGAVYGYGTDQGGKMRIQNGKFITADNGYIKDGTTGQDGVSKIDENNLKKIATQLGVPYEKRTSDERIAPQELKGEIILSDNLSSMETLKDYTWVVGLILLTLVSIDMGNIYLQFRKAQVKVKEVSPHA